MTAQTPDSADVRRLLGELSDRQVLEVLATGATIAELEAAAILLAGADDALGDDRLPTSGPVARVAEIVARDEDWGEGDAPRP